ncbi:N-acetylneuraminate synthase family protein [Undibacter mobilis]|nr:N-acetylneuraminate synthase family protein [Undibacter mobilis]
MNLFGRYLDNDVAVIAEIGVNHEGSVESASTLLRLAAEAGADAVKLQTYTPSRFVTTSNQQRFERVTRFALSRQDHLRLRDEAAELGVSLFSTAVTEDVVDFVATLGPAVKIASGDLNFRPVLEAAMRTGKAVILSTGNSTLDEIDTALSWCRDASGQQNLSDRLVLLHCVASYPAPMHDLNLLSIPFLKERYGLPTGYSNHAVEPEAVIAATALGAQVIEVHFTDRRAGRTFHDHSLSFEPEEMRKLITGIRAVRAACGQYGRPVLPSEVALRPLMRKGVVAARDLPAGTVLAAGDMAYARPATEFNWSDVDGLVGRQLIVSLHQGELIPAAGVAPAGN